MKVAIPSFFLGGGGGGEVSEEVETLGEAPPPLNARLPRAVNHSVDPPSFWIHPCFTYSTIIWT